MDTGVIDDPAWDDERRRKLDGVCSLKFSGPEVVRIADEMLAQEVGIIKYELNRQRDSHMNTASN